MSDVHLYYLRYVLNTENAVAVEAAFAANPKCKAIAEAVEKDEKVAAYLVTRKETPM